MIDIHSHILFGVDDGAPDFEESVRMLKEAKNAGFHTIIATPHVRKYVSTQTYCGKYGDKTCSGL